MGTSINIDRNLIYKGCKWKPPQKTWGNIPTVLEIGVKYKYHDPPSISNTNRVHWKELQIKCLYPLGGSYSVGLTDLLSVNE